MAGGRGFEPRLAGPEPAVLPLYDPPPRPMKLINIDENVKKKWEDQ